jgi:hypothetical protein
VLGRCPTPTLGFVAAGARLGGGYGAGYGYGYYTKRTAKTGEKVVPEEVA